MDSKYVIRLVEVDQVRPLRAKILRPNQPFSTSLYAQDADENAFHIAAYGASQEVIGTASAYVDSAKEVLSEVYQKQNVQMWRMRGVAVADEHRGKNIGRQLVQFLEAEIKIRQPQLSHLLWANARESALPFYAALGYQGEGAFFALPHIGLHQVIWRILDSAD